jgi:preprotein translocase subunit SecE
MKVMDQGTQTQNTEAAKPGFNPMEFARETRGEIAKVTWPSRKETLQMTTIVIVMALLAGVFFLAIDSMLGFAISHILGMNS